MDMIRKYQQDAQAKLAEAEKAEDAETRDALIVEAEELLVLEGVWLIGI